jgi:hypothetical protein
MKAFVVIFGIKKFTELGNDHDHAALFLWQQLMALMGW